MHDDPQLGMDRSIESQTGNAAITSLVKPIAHLQADCLTKNVFYQNYQKPGIPVLISGLVHLDQNWSLDYLCEWLGAIEFPVRHYGRQRYEQDKRTWSDIGSGVEVKNMPFCEYATLLKSGVAHEQDLYLGKCSIEHTPLAKVATFDQIKMHLGLKRSITAWNLWVGLGGHITCLHYDSFDGTLLQLQGSKRLILFPPSQLYNLYPFPISVHLKNGLNLRSAYSQIYPDKPDFHQFPKLMQAFQHRYEVILNPGDVLYIPAGWMHEVIALGNEMVCSVNRFWSIQPFVRALFCWSKWRSHLGSVLTAPYVLKNLFTAMRNGDRQQTLGQLLQKL
jgi:lysine-specific demethylase 8/hypoxia-inducible factor 1-alpha inhibitor (HIF hydroxylase)